MSPSLISLIVATVLTSLALPFVLVFLRRRNISDEPSERSSHTVPTPRGGGLAQIFGLVGSSFTIPTAPAGLTPVFGFALLGFVDDLRSTRPIVRLGVQLFLGVWAAVLIMEHDGSNVRVFVALGAAAGWFVLVVNAANFMDGINGLSALHGVVLGGVYWTLLNQFNPNWAPVAAALVGISAAFLPWNWRKQAKLFLGDSGSYLLGALLAFLSVHLWVSSGSVLIALAPLSVYVADVLLTLAKRVARRAPLMTPHREHVYQQLVDLGISQTYVSALVAFLSALAGLLAICAARQNLPVMVTTGALTVIVLAYLVLPKCGLRLLR